MIVTEAPAIVWELTSETVPLSVNVLLGDVGLPLHALKQTRRAMRAVRRAMGLLHLFRTGFREPSTHGAYHSFGLNEGGTKTEQEHKPPTCVNESAVTVGTEMTTAIIAPLASRLTKFPDFRFTRLLAVLPRL